MDSLKECSNKTTPLPPDLYEGVGLIGEGMLVAKELGAFNIPQYNFSSVITLLSSILAGKIRLEDVRTSCFFIRIGGSGSGKTHVNGCFDDLVRSRFDVHVKKPGKRPSEISNPIYGTTDFASYKALCSAVKESPHGLIILDDITFYFNGWRGHFTGWKGKALLKLSSNAKEIMDGIDGSAINLIGNAKLCLLDKFKPDDLQSLFQFFDFFYYDGPRPLNTTVYDRITSNDVKLSEGWVNKLVALYRVEKPRMPNASNADSAINIGIDECAKKFMKKYVKDINDAVNMVQDDGLRRIINRSHDTTIMFALIHAGATRKPDRIFDPLTLADIEWGAKIANMQLTWKRTILMR